MPQSLTRLPEEVEFKIGEWHVTVQNHVITEDMGLFGIIMNIVTSSDLDRKALLEFEKRGISFEAAIECCVEEIENNTDILAKVLWWHYDTYKISEMPCDHRYLNPTYDFSKRDAGRKIAVQLVEKIRSCENWGELYDELNLKSQFQKEMEYKIISEVKEYCLRI